MYEEADIDNIKETLFASIKHHLRTLHTNQIARYYEDFKSFLCLYLFLVVLPENHDYERNQLWLRRQQLELVEDLKQRFALLQPSGQRTEFKIRTSDLSLKTLLEYFCIRRPTAAQWSMASLLTLNELFKNLTAYLTNGDVIDLDEPIQVKEKIEEQYNLDKLQTYLDAHFYGHLVQMEAISKVRPAHYLFFMLTFERFNRAHGWPELDQTLLTFLQTAEAQLLSVASELEHKVGEEARLYQETAWDAWFEELLRSEDSPSEYEEKVNSFRPDLTDDWDEHTLYRPVYFSAFLERHVPTLPIHLQAVVMNLVNHYFNSEENFRFGQLRDLRWMVFTQLSEAEQKNPIRPKLVETA